MADSNNNSPINNEFNQATVGLNMDNSVSQTQKGQLSYGLNSVVETFDANSVSYQNEPGNEHCCSFPSGFLLMGHHFIVEQNKHLFFLSNPTTGDSEIGYMINNDCVYRKLVNAVCLNFNIKYPIHKVVHKITNCTTEIYFTDGFNPRRYLDLNNIPYILQIDSDLCDPVYTDQLDCNQLKVQPNFAIPQLKVSKAISGGENVAGTVQFATQYSDASGNPYTSFYSVTNPTPLADVQITTPNFNYNVGKSIVLDITNIDTTGQFQYYNIAVIKTINNIESVDLVGTYSIERATDQITYTGQSVDDIKLTINDIFEKYPYYDIAQDVTAVQDVLVWDQLTSIDRINYQSIWSKIGLQWQTYRIPSTENYSDELNATNLRGYLRDEVYPFEGVFLLKNGKQTDGFHIPGRLKNINELQPDIPNTNPDFIGEPDYYIDDVGYSPYWKIYNTGSVTGTAEGPSINNATPYQYGEMAYWESIETYPCNDDVWGELAGQPIRHHKFPDVLVSPIFESPTYTLNPGFSPTIQDNAVFPIGVKIDVEYLRSLINTSSLTAQQKSDIVGFKIVRGDRGTNKSIIAKGMFRNVSKYTRQETDYFFPNYPYNDLEEDPFLMTANNKYTATGQAEPWMIDCVLSGVYEYTDVDTALIVTKDMQAGKIYEVCSLTRPIFKSGSAKIGPSNYDVYEVDCIGSNYSPYYGRAVTRWSTDNSPLITLNGPLFGPTCAGPWYARRLDVGTVPYQLETGQPTPNTILMGFQTCDEGEFPVDQYVGTLLVPAKNWGRRTKLQCIKAEPLPPITTDDAKYRQVFNSPETSFGNPFLGGIVKLENVMFGGGKAHFVEVKENAKYRLLSKEAQQDSLAASTAIAVDDITALFTAYQAYLTIYVNGITRKNYAYSYNSIASYDYSGKVPNNTGYKQRELDIKQYLIPSVQNVGDTNNINNYQRESSVYLKTDDTKTPLPFPNKTPDLTNSAGDSLFSDKSRIVVSTNDACDHPEKEQDISVVSYYGSLKNLFLNQWGQIYSYNTIDTGFQVMFNIPYDNNVIFGGDTFISRFAYKTKIPFFIDNRVGAPDDSDIFYDEIGNVAYPRYWHSARSVLFNYGTLLNIISIKAHNFDCYKDPSKVPASSEGPSGTFRTFYDGIFYLFAYGVPNFYCESSYNTDLRQAFNNKEGDFWPHISTGIPDDWFQEKFVSIANDNTYYYNATYSKQNKENFFTHLPADWSEKLCFTNYPFRTIYSDPQETDSDIRVNNWLVYKPLSYFDFPQNYGKLTSLDGIQNKAILARFENKSLLYNNLLTLDTSNPQNAYLGSNNMFSGAPPIDFAETDLGYVGSQNKFLLKIPQGQITVDAKRGQIFLINGTQAIDLTAFGSGVNRFMTDHLSFEITDYFPDIEEIINNERIVTKGVNTDNHFNGIGLHGVYDSKFDRIIITKLDYVPIDPDVKYDNATQEFYIEHIVAETPIRTQVYLMDEEYFCNRSWTMSFNFNTKSWVSFHSYIPNWYMGENNFFYSGINGCCDADIESSFSAFIGTLDKTITTTSTTTFAPYNPPTTTVKPAECEMEGEGFVTQCELEGEAIITVAATTTTTTTICQRPSNLTGFSLIYGYTLGADPFVPFDSLDAVCDSFPIIQDYYNGNINSTVLATMFTNTFTVNPTEAIPLLGEIVYMGEGMSCDVIPDGWYLVEDSNYQDYVYHVEEGIIIEITTCGCETTTTTTTLPPDIPECCGIIFSQVDNGVYFYNENNEMTTLDIPGYISGRGIAMTATKLWSVDVNIMEWDITLSPFTATFNRTILLGDVTSIGSMCALNDTTLVLYGDYVPSVYNVIEADITTGTSVNTSVIALPVDYSPKVNPLYTTTGKILIIAEDTTTSLYHILQYDYATAVQEFNISLEVGMVVTSLYQCGCNIYVTNTSGVVYVLVKAAPYPLLETINIIEVDDITGATQVGTCVTSSIDLFDTTTTTTTL
jgi:hypothetical protein